MEHPSRFAPRIARDTAPGHTPRLESFLGGANPHRCYVESLATIRDLMIKLCGTARENPDMPVQQIAIQLSEMAQHAKDQCSTCTDERTATAVFAAEEVFMDAAREYLASDHQQTSSSLAEITHRLGEDGDPDARYEYPFLDLVTALSARH